MSSPITRAHLKQACDEKHWDLLDKLLEIDSSQINDNALYTDTWGEWWGMLMECIFRNQVDGVRVLLARGASRDVGTWGDGIPMTARDAAADLPEILVLLDAADVSYTRATQPEIPAADSPEDDRINRQGEIRDQTGMVFPVQPDEPG